MQENEVDECFLEKLSKKGDLMPTFDIVNEVDMAEVDNAINQANRELTQRFDFKGSKTEIQRDKEALTIESADDYKVKAAIDVLQGKLTKRGVSLKVIELKDIEPAAGGRARQKGIFKEGIEKDKAKELIKMIKETKMKVQPSIQGDLVRVSGKKIDDLQEIIGFLKEKDFSLPLQFINFRD